MSVRFKFRSAVSFDSVDLGGRRSISVRDLRARIVAQKKLHLGHDFDLLLSDADTGIGFDDEEAEIEAGSSVVIKRVPADRSAVARDFDAGIVARNGGGYVEKVALPPTKNVDMEDFDDFGVDLYPDLQGSFPEPYAAMDNLNFTTNEKDNAVRRCPGISISRHPNKESDRSEAMSKEVIGDNCCKEPETLEIKLDAENDVSKKLDQYVRMPSAELNMDLPTELRCSLCNAIFKEAVMIPCCQHSFCDKCVRLALLETARCPKCSSMKCTVNDLLPNLSLRQAIEHFLEAQVAISAPQNNIPHYAPDGESGIHAKEMSCAVSIRRKEQPHPHSPSTTGRGSNQVMAESAYGGKRNSDTGSHLIRLESGKFGKSTVPPRKIGEMKGDENSSAEVTKRMSGLQGNNVSSKLPQNILQEEANTAMQKKKGLGFIVSDGSGTSMQPSWHRKAGRNCYNCGSPDHLIRDCPQASNTYPVNQTGDAAFAGGMSAYQQSYWHGAPFAHAGPYANMYGAPGMMPFDQTMVPVSPFGISPYMSSMYAGMPIPYGFMRMGGMQHPMMTGVRPYTREAFMDPQDVERKHKSLDEHPPRFKEHDRGNTSEDYYYNGIRRVSHERTHQLNEEATESFVDDDNQMIHKKRRHDKHYGFSHQETSIQSDELHTYERRHEKNCHKSASGRDQRSHRSEKSNSEVHDLSDSSNRHSKERKKHHHEDCIKKQGERHSHHSRERRGHHRRQIETSDDEKVVADHRNHSRRHPHHSGSGVEHSSSSERRQHYKEKDLIQCSRPSKQLPKSKDDQVDYDRWEMEDGLDGDYKDERRCHKRKRTR
ncbi:E3 ubiquitin ligase PQT3-like isoform X1 [Iris pallida]|uniref:E3 ubiquitin ligase PQT3-like isoform X1 n=1 Tax=Iris pallida TaxID=29817 RepID=A0AAX6H6K3_IRIPA|nr:E3 ubiquitin ligase PQT3-like isoform X1 [Iris pallida]